MVKVELCVDGNKVGEDSSASYNISLDTTTLGDSGHVLVAKAYDGLGNVRTSAEIVINVENTSQESPAG